MVRFETFLAGRPPDEALLKEYLRSKAEWVAFELKTAKDPPVFGMRISVAAFSNTDGGDLFLGVANNGDVLGTPVDLAVISQILRQEGAPAREGCSSNLIEVVRDPIKIPLEGLSPVYWLNVAPFGRLAAVLHEDGTLGLYDRPGAESKEVRGFDAIDMFRRKTRARLLLDLFEEFERVVGRIPSYVQGSTDVREDMVVTVRAILNSEDWRRVALKDDWNLTNSAYVGPLLSYPAEYAEWVQTVKYQELDNRIRYRKNQLSESVRNFRRYLVDHRVIPP
jgi:hypothetical protein